jgi:hypothetical protein
MGFPFESELRGLFGKDGVKQGTELAEKRLNNYIEEFNTFSSTLDALDGPLTASQSKYVPRGEQGNDSLTQEYLREAKERHYEVRGATPINRGEGIITANGKVLESAELTVKGLHDAKTKINRLRQSSENNDLGDVRVVFDYLNSARVHMDQMRHLLKKPRSNV